MALQEIPHPDYIGVDVDADDAERVLRLLRFLLSEGERVVALATTVKALPTLTHIAVTERRVLGLSVADLAKDGPRQETGIAAVASVEGAKVVQAAMVLRDRGQCGYRDRFRRRA